MKYIIEIAKEYEEYFKGILICGIAEGKFAVDVIAKEDLEELNSDYINEHFGSLQGDAYQRGLEDGKQTAIGAAELREKLEYQKGFKDGKAQVERGCEGCKYECENKTKVPCILCSNNFKLPCTISSSKLENQWTAKDDKIEVGDVVMIKQFKHPENHLFVVTKVSDESVWGVEGDGSWNYWAINEVIKTDKHFDIQKILEAMKHD